MTMPRCSLNFFTIAIALSLSACSTVGYYAHLAHGEYALMHARKPIDDVIADPKTDLALKSKLLLAEQARAFASDHLQLPRNRSYTRYADLHRAYATWNVFATEEFSVDALKHCFPLIGCIGYRGYYDRERAEREAAQLRKQGFETYIGGSTAYSTLGWFADPILNTMVRWGDDELIGTIFHELTHQKIYIKDDTEFNESLAMFVQQEGLQQWRESHGLARTDVVELQHDEQFTALVLQTRGHLKTLYASNESKDAMRQHQREEIDQLRGNYFRLRDTDWHGDGAYDTWINSDINNAKLVPFGLYNTWVSAFAALYKKQPLSGDGVHDWSKFFDAAAVIGKLDADARKGALRELASDQGLLNK